MSLFLVKGSQLNAQKGAPGRNANARKLQVGDGLETIQRSRQRIVLQFADQGQRAQDTKVRKEIYGRGTKWVRWPTNLEMEDGGWQGRVTTAQEPPKCTSVTIVNSD